MIKEQLIELMGLIYELDQVDTANNWFFDYAGHVKGVSVYYRSVDGSRCECCGGSVSESTTVTALTNISDLQPLIVDLKSRLSEMN
jgi:hypothetical protein